MKIISLIVLVIMLLTVPVFAQPAKPLTKDQIIERVGQIDKQLLLLEKQELIKKYQELEKAEKPKPEKKEVK